MLLMANLRLHCQIPGHEMLLNMCAGAWLSVTPGMSGWRGPCGQLSLGDPTSILCSLKISVKEQFLGVIAGRRKSQLARGQSWLGQKGRRFPL